MNYEKLLQLSYQAIARPLSPKTVAQILLSPQYPLHCLAHNQQYTTNHDSLQYVESMSSLVNVIAHQKRTPCYVEILKRARDFVIASSQRFKTPDAKWEPSPHERFVERVRSLEQLTGTKTSVLNQGQLLAVLAEQGASESAKRAAESFDYSANHIDFAQCLTAIAQLREHPAPVLRNKRKEDLAQQMNEAKLSYKHAMAADAGFYNELQKRRTRSELQKMMVRVGRQKVFEKAKALRSDKAIKNSAEFVMLQVYEEQVLAALQKQRPEIDSSRAMQLGDTDAVLRAANPSGILKIGRVHLALDTREYLLQQLTQTPNPRLCGRIIMSLVCDELRMCHNNKVHTVQEFVKRIQPDTLLTAASSLYEQNLITKEELMVAEEARGQKKPTILCDLF